MAGKASGKAVDRLAVVDETQANRQTIEIYELVPRASDPARHGHPLLVLIILALNILIVWYLFQNRHRLFRHHHH